MLSLDLLQGRICDYLCMDDLRPSVQTFVAKQAESYASHILRELANQQKIGQNLDFLLCCTGSQLACHRAVLAAASPMFQSFFTQSGVNCIYIKNIDMEVLQVILDFMYGRNISIPKNKLGQLLCACDYFNIAPLMKQIQIFITDHMTVKNCLQWWRVANTLDWKATCVYAKAKRIMLSEFEKVSKTASFLNLSDVELVEYIQHHDLKVSHQDQVLHACVSWGLADVTIRKQFMLKILQAVQIRKCSPASLRAVCGTHNELFSDENTRWLLLQVFMSMVDLAGERNPKTQRIMILGGVEDIKKNSPVFSDCWVRHVGQSIGWERAGEIPNNLQGKHTRFVGIPGGLAALCGGPNWKLNSKYNQTDNVWTDLPPLPYIAFSAVVPLYQQGKIHVLDGGLQDGVSKPTNRMATLDLCKLAWNAGPHLLVSQVLPIATAHKRSLYVVLNSGSTKSVQCSLQELSSGVDRWKYKQNLPKQVNPCGANMVGYNDSLFLVGGCNKICVKYDIGKDMWTELTRRPSIDHWYGAAFVLGNKVYVCGGGHARSGRLNNAIEEYDPETGQWSVCSMRLPRSMILFSAVCVDME